MNKKQKINIRIVVLTTCLFFLLLSSAFAASDITERYDENTEITVRGDLTQIIRTTRGPLIVMLQSGSNSYNVVIAPMWYVAQKNMTFSKGDVVEAKGSKYFAKDGKLYIISKEVKNISKGTNIVLRDSHCRPLWKRQRMHNRQIP